MKKNLGPQTYLFPLPVLIICTYDEKRKANAMNAAWGGIYDTNQIHICLSSSHKTTQNIEINKAFTVSFGVKKYVKECDYFGLKSGNKEENKIEKAGMHTIKSEFVDAPVIEEFPITLECKVNHLTYDETKETTYVVGDIVNVLVDEECLINGKFDAHKAEIICFNTSSHKYELLGEEVANAFNVGLQIK